LNEIEGVVDHSMEGSMGGAWAVLASDRQASWHFSIPRDGEPLQHYAVEDICWHAGLPGDRKFDTSIIGNLTLVGKEYEGWGTDAWTQSQVYWGARIDVALRETCPHFAANPPILRLNQWEHRWLSSTSCPSGRNLWRQKFELIREMEDDMAMSQTEFNEMLEIGLRQVKFSPADYAAHPITAWLDSYHKHRLDDSIHGSDGYTDAQAVKAVKDKLS
jgi:hypothetical protein